MINSKKYNLFNFFIHLKILKKSMYKKFILINKDKLKKNMEKN